MDPYTLIPIANNLVSKVYKMGDVLLKAGQEVDRLMIVSQVRCKVIFLGPFIKTKRQLLKLLEKLKINLQRT